MATDKHFNEQGAVPEPLEDHRGTDMPATRNMFVVILALAVFGLVVLIILQRVS